MPRFPRATGSSPVVIAPAVWNDLCDLIEAGFNITVAAPLQISRGGAGIRISILPGRENVPIFFGEPAGAGRYHATLARYGGDAVDPGTDFDANDPDRTSISAEIIVDNLQESGAAGSQFVGIGTPFYAWPTGRATTDNVPVYETNLQHSVRYNRFNTVTGEFQETYFYAATREDVPEEAWVTWHQADICPDTGAAAQAAIVTQPSSGDLAYSMGMIR